MLRLCVKIDIEEIKNEIDHICGTLECEFSNVIDNEGDEREFSRLDDVIQQIKCIRDDLMIYYRRETDA